MSRKSYFLNTCRYIAPLRHILVSFSHTL